MADPRSGCRVEGHVAAADAIVRTAPPTLPETVVLLGRRGSRRRWAIHRGGRRGQGARVIVVDPWHQWPDPTRVATEFHHCDVDTWLRAATESRHRCAPDVVGSWQAMEDAAQSAIDGGPRNRAQRAAGGPPSYAYAAARGATVVVSASMPLRDLEWYAAPQPPPPRVLANRGANGIDGVVSTALGVAAARRPSRPWRCSGTWPSSTTCRAWSTSTSIARCTFVVVDNGGGGIFSFLPQAGAPNRRSSSGCLGRHRRSDMAAVRTRLRAAG